MHHTRRYPAGSLFIESPTPQGAYTRDTPGTHNCHCMGLMSLPSPHDEQHGLLYRSQPFAATQNLRLGMLTFAGVGSGPVF